MKLHTCKVRLQGEVKDEVLKINATAAEIRVLQSIHGDDAVLDIKPTGEADRSEAEERKRLMAIYGQRTVEEMFGVKVATVTGELPDEMLAPVEDEDPAPAPKQALPTARRSARASSTDTILE